MTEDQTPNGFTGNMFFEELLRQFLKFQFQEIEQNASKPGNTFVDELFSRYGDDVRLQAKKWFITQKNIAVTINYPRDPMTIPFVCIINEDENEKAGEAYLGDHGGVLYQGAHSVQASSQLQIPTLYGALNEVDDRPRAIQARYLLSVPESHVTRVYCATENVNSTLYLYTMVKALLLVNKMDFDRYVGARNMTMGGGDFAHHPELFPDFAYFRVITLNYDMNFDVPLAPNRTIGGVDVSIKRFLYGGSNAE